MENNSENSTLCLLFQKTEKLMSDYFNTRLTTTGMDIRSEHWMILVLLNESGRITQQEIAGKLYKDKTYITRAVDFLEERGLAKRLSCQSDRRNKFVKLTPEGKSFVESHQNTIEKGVTETFNGLLSSEKTETLALLLSEFHQKMSEMVKK